MKTVRMGLLLFVCVAALLTTAARAALAADWPQWRGPNRDNVSRETGLLKEWPSDGPPLVWRAEGIGEGIASVSVAGGRIFTVGYQEESEFAVALEQRNGKKLWTKRLGSAVIPENALMRLLSQRTPTVDGGRVYVLSAEGHLVCLRTDNGKELWRKRFPEEFKKTRPTWGYCDHPLVDGEKLICAPCARDATLMALDKRSGKVLWKTTVPGEERQGYAAIVLTKGGGVRQYVAFTGTGIVGVAAADGKLLWRYDRLSDFRANSYTPIPCGDLLFCGNGYSHGIALLKLVRQGENIAAQEQYYVDTPLDPFQDGMAWAGDRAYAVRGNGRLFCIEVSTGKRLWEVGAMSQRGKAALLWADDRLYVRYSSGVISFGQTSPAGYTERGLLTLPAVTPSVGATAPVIADGRLLLRDNNRLFCYDIREVVLKQPRKAPATVIIKLEDPNGGGEPTAQRPGRTKLPDAVFVPTPQDVVEAMLELAGVRKDDVVTDLGSGDGRIVIAAAKKYGSKAIGYEIDPMLVALSRKNVSLQKVDTLVKIEPKDFFTADLREIDVVAVFLYPDLLKRLLPQFAAMKTGSRIVSHQFSIPGVKPDRVLRVKSQESGDEHTLYLWTIPLQKEP